jgi:hypothetical protein
VSKNLDKFNRPTNLEDYDDPTIRWPDHTATNAWWTSLYQKRTTADRNATLHECILMIHILMRQYEAHFSVHKYDPTLLQFPYLFKRPADGSIIKNKTTGAHYVVQETPIDPVSKSWDGLVKIESTDSPPDRTQAHKLEFLDDSLYVRFTSEDPKRLGTESQDANGLVEDKGPFLPTVVYALIRKTPGSLTTNPFGSARQYRPVYRETHALHDSATNTVEISGQWFDHLVQFDCWSTDNFSADQLADWFERFMSLYGRVLKKNGVLEVLFLERLRDKAVSQWRQDFQNRSLQYYIRTETLEARVNRILTDIDITINLSNKIVDVVGEYYVAGQVISGQMSTEQYRDLFLDSNGNYLFGTSVLNDQNLT